MPLPHILDNRTSETLHSSGLGELIELHPADPLAVATGYVNLGGLNVLAELSKSVAAAAPVAGVSQGRSGRCR